MGIGWGTLRARPIAWRIEDGCRALTGFKDGRGRCLVNSSRNVRGRPRAFPFAIDPAARCAAPKILGKLPFVGNSILLGCLVYFPAQNSTALSFGENRPAG
jgi:hypothetical protein